MSQPQPLEEISCTFNIFDNGRQFSGQNRGYVLDNIAAVLNAPVAKERIKLREAVGYYSHGVRRAAGLDPDETTIINVAGKPMMINATPSNVTVAQSISSDGDVAHVQQILDNDEGRKALGLHNSKIGGFSWACSPASGVGGGGSTRVSKWYGYDYVRNPLFVRNRGHILDSAEDQEQMILDCMLATGLEAGKAQQAVANLVQDAIIDAEHYRDQLENVFLDQGVMDAAINESNTAKEQLAAAKAEIQSLTVQIDGDKNLRQHILDSVAQQFNVGSISNDIRGQILEGSPDGLDALFSLVGRTSAKAHALGSPSAEKIDAASVGGWGESVKAPAVEVNFEHKNTGMRTKHFS